MSSDTYNYYKEELDQIGAKPDPDFDTGLKFNPVFQFRNSVDNGQTKWLTLNKESIKELRKFLDRIEPTLS